MQTRRIVEEPYAEGRVMCLEHQLHSDGNWITIAANVIPMSTATPLTGSSAVHARLAPSDAKRWLTCTRSISFEKENEDRVFEMAVQSVRRLIPYLKSLPPEEVFPHEGRAMRWIKDLAEGRTLTDEQKKDIWKSEGSEYAREGTRAHEFATRIFSGEITLEDIPEDFRQPVGFYVDFCKAQLLTPDETMIVETKVPLFYDPNSTGTRDFCIVRPNHIIIDDYKHGQGELVDAEGNPQCAIYGLSTVRDLEDNWMQEFDPDTTIEIWIIQPRHHADLPAKNWTLTLGDLRAFGEHIQKVHDQIVEGRDLVFAPSDDACRWCKCKAFCPARAEALTGMLDGPDYTGIDLLKDLPDIEDIPGTTTKKEFNSRPPEERVNARLGERGPLPLDVMVAVKLNKSAIHDLIDDIAEHVDDLILSGEKHELLKIVNGNPGDRKWIDEAAADKMLANKLKSDERYNRKLISPAQAEKLIDFKSASTKFKNLFANAITRADGKKVVVGVGDKRAAVAAIADDLEDIPEADSYAME